MQTKFGAIIVDGSGKTNGHVATKNRNGNALRTKIKPSNKRSSAQMRQRNFFATIANAWNQLGVADVAAWNAAAENVTYSNAFGDKKKYTGRALFQKYNLNILTVGGDILTTPASSEPVPGAEIAVEQVPVATLKVDWTAGLAAPGTMVVIYATPKLRNGQTYVKGKYRFVKTATLVAGTANLITEFTALFGAPQIGDRFSIQIKTISPVSGQESIAATGFVSVIA